MLEDKPPWLAHSKDIPDTFEEHLKYPDVSFERYTMEQRIRLGRSVLQKTRIYLDQKYWICCRDAMRGRPQKPIHRDIHNALRKAVEAGTAICPMSHAVFEEAFKQTDPESRKATAEVVEQLSSNVALQPFMVLLDAEVSYYITSFSDSQNIIPLAEAVWTYPSCLYGELYPKPQGVDKTTINAMRKAWFDYHTHVPFSVIVEAPREADDMPTSHDTDEYQAAQTRRCREHKHEFRSFKQVFITEVSGILDLLRERFEQILLSLWEAETGTKRAVDDLEVDPQELNVLANLIRIAFEKGKIGTELPSIRIFSGIHAAKRYRDDPFKKGDWHDSLNARMALPYCDMFMTEKNLGHLLTRPPLEYDKLYDCRVLWNDEEVLASVLTLT